MTEQEAIEREKFNAWWDLKGRNSVILRAQAWSAWLARAEAEQQQPEDECDNLVIQDKVPVRRGIDRISWVSDDPAQSIAPSENGHSLGKMYGAPRPAGASGQHDKDAWLRVWCKQKDLPKIEQDEKSEDPDEWVILDPVKYADHVPRVGIDQFGSNEEGWRVQCAHHTVGPVGEYYDEYRLYHRCRRRDLPKVEQVRTTEELKAEFEAGEAVLAAIDARLNEQAEQWPKYYHAIFKANQIAFVRRDNFYQYTPVMHDGTELKQQPWFGDDNCRIELTEDEAMALIQKPNPQPQKTRVRLFASFGALHIRMPGEITEGIGREVKHDSEGFYVE